jgi:hypothetical protein
MKNVQKIIKESGCEGCEFFALKLENAPYMPLNIEGIGRSADGRLLVSVAHYGYQNGDAMRDPDIVFLLAEETPGFKDGWFPISIQNDYIASYREAIRWDEDGKMLQNPREMRDIKRFANIWDKNIKNQGFLEVIK